MEFFIGIVVGVGLMLLRNVRRVPQNDAEVAVSARIRRRFPGADYHLINNITLNTGKTTTQIDHVLVSQYGVFVIETKGYKGWVFGDPKSPQWTQVIYRSKFRFGNPLRQNAGHVAALQQLFDLDQACVHSLVVFCGTVQFKTQMPPNVIHFAELAAYLETFKEKVLSYEQVVQSAICRACKYQLAEHMCCN